MNMFDNYGGAPYEEPEYDDSDDGREIVAFYHEDNGTLTFWRYESLIEADEEYNDDIEERLTKDEREFFCEEGTIPLESCQSVAKEGECELTFHEGVTFYEGDNTAYDPDVNQSYWVVTKIFPATSIKGRKLMTLNEFVGYEVDSFGSWGRSVYKYTDCGPWVVALLPDGSELYYEDREAWDYTGDQLITGVRLGSIVEGWDGELPPYECHSREEFDKALEELNDTCCSIWDTANSDHFLICKDGYQVGYAKQCWGDVTLDVDDLTAKDRRHLTRWLRMGRYMPGNSCPTEGQVFKVSRQLSVTFLEPEIYPW